MNSLSLKNIVLLLVFGFIAIFVQGTLLKSLSPNLVVPNFLVILVVFLGFTRVTPAGVVTAFLLGLQLDLYTAQLLGPWAGAFVATFAVLAALSQHVYVESPLAIFSAVFVACILSTLVYFFFIYEFRPAVSFSVGTAFIEALLTALFGPFIFRFLFRLMPPEEKGVGTKLSRVS